MKKIIIDYKDIKDFNQEIDMSLLKEGFIFNECCLIVKNHPGTKRDLKVSVWFDTEHMCMYYAVFDTEFKTRTYILLYNKMLGFQIGRCDKDIDDEEQGPSAGLCDLVLNVVQTIKENSYNRAIYYKKHEDEKQEVLSKIRKLSKQKKRYKCQDIYLADELTYYASVKIPEEKLKRHMNCPCWDVRGFYRHYKNGNVVWINSFQKGKDRNKGLSNDRTYNASKHDKK